MSDAADNSPAPSLVKEEASRGASGTPETASTLTQESPSNGASSPSASATTSAPRGPEAEGAVEVPAKEPTTALAPANRRKGPPLLSDDDRVLVAQLVQNQAKDLELKALEIQNRASVAQNAHDLSLRSLDVQSVDRERERQHSVVLVKAGQRFFLLALAALLSFACFCIWREKAELAADVIKFLLTSLVSGAGGYGLAMYRVQKQKDKEDK
jgi:hypothetical protein